MSFQKRIGRNVTLKVDENGGTSYTSFARVIDGYQVSGNKAEIHPIPIQADVWIEKAKTQIDAGQIAFTIAMDPQDTESQLVARLLAAYGVIPATWQLSYAAVASATLQTRSFSGWLSSANEKGKMKELIVLDITIDISGTPAYATS